MDSVSTRTRSWSGTVTTSDQETTGEPQWRLPCKESIKKTPEEQERDRRLAEMKKVALKDISDVSKKGTNLKRWFTANQERADKVKQESRQEEAGQLVKVIVPQFIVGCENMSK